MKVLVICTNATEGGALTILRSFIKEAEGDDSNRYIFLTSVNITVKSPNTQILKVKRPGWVRRIYFEFVGCKRYIEKIHPDLVLSLQNTLPNMKVSKKYLYVHQALPFQNIRRYSLFKKEERGLAIRQQILGARIKKSCRRADKIIVQTKWMKKAIISSCSVEQSKIEVRRPVLYISNKILKKKTNINYHSFFYPTSHYLYKNNDALINAANILIKNGITDFRLELTLDGISTKNIKYLGQISHDEVMKKYKESVLVFPSLFESYGLPLAEARLLGGIILAADTPYSREVLNDYDNVVFFDPIDVAKIAEAMKGCMYEK